MHEVSLNQVIQDYLTGEDIELTTYEDIRQALARILVEEKGYPPSNIKSKFPLDLNLKDKHYTIVLDFVVYYQGDPVFILAFCPGAIATYVTQYICAARIFPDKPVPYVLVTDSKDATLMETSTKKELCRGYTCIPHWHELVKMAENTQPFEISAERIQKDRRVAHAMFALSDGCCTTHCESPRNNESRSN